MEFVNGAASPMMCIGESVGCKAVGTAPRIASEAVPASPW